jgi:hypothetical protein
MRSENPANKRLKIDGPVTATVEERFSCRILDGLIANQNVQRL